MSMVFAWGLPSPGTGFFLVLCRGHLRQFRICQAMRASWFCLVCMGCCCSSFVVYFGLDVDLNLVKNASKHFFG